MTDIRIESLVLHGFAADQRPAIVAAVRAELAESLAGWTPASTTIPALDAGPVTVAAGAPPSVIGRAVATRLATAIRGSVQPAGRDT